MKNTYASLEIDKETPPNDLHEKLIQNFNEKEFDDDSIPPDFSLCQKHLKANTVGIENLSLDEVCQCCGNRVNKSPITICDENTKLAYLGPGFTLFFLFLKWAIGILFIFFSVAGIFELISNYSGSNCQIDNDCSAGWETLFSIYNKKNDEENVEIQHWLNFALIILLILVLQLMRRSIKKQAASCDENDISASDFTIIVENIPKKLNINYVEELKKFFENQVITLSSNENAKPIVAKVIITYNLNDLNKMKRAELDAVSKKNAAFKAKFKKGSFPFGVTKETLDGEINQREKEILDYEKELFLGRQGDISGVAFVSFETEDMKQSLCEKYKVSESKRLKQAFIKKTNHVKDQELIFFGNQLYIKEASEPGDIYWNNLYVEDKERYIRKFLGYIFSAFLLFCCGVLIYILLEEQNEIKQKNKKAKDMGDTNQENLLKIKVLTVILAVAIAVINKFLMFLMPIIVSFEKNQTMTDDYSSVAQKLSMALFINSGFLSFFVTYVIVGNYAGSGGLLIAMTGVFITNSLINPLMHTINIEYLLSLLKRWFYSRQNDHCSLTQGQANKIFENPPFPIQSTAASFINILWFTAFYSAVLPIGIVFSLGCFIYEYFILKHMLIKRSTVLYEMGTNLTEEMTDLIEVSLVWFGIGNFIFNMIFDNQNQASIPTILTLVVAIIHYFLPTEQINDYLFKINSKNEVIQYSEVFSKFDKDYDRENPATKEYALANLVNKQ